MVKYSETQKQIAVILMHSPKTLEQLDNQLNASSAELMTELKEMLNLKVISKEGYPTVYKLNKDISQEVVRRKEVAENDSNKIRLNIIIEASAAREDTLKTNLGKIRKSLEGEKLFTVYSINEAKPLKDEDHYSAYIEAGITVKDLHSMIKLVHFYGPSSLEVIRPPSVEITAADLQESLVELSNFAQQYNSTVNRVLNKAELEQFRKKLFQN